MDLSKLSIVINSQHDYICAPKIAGNSLTFEQRTQNKDLVYVIQILNKGKYTYFTEYFTKSPKCWI